MYILDTFCEAQWLLLKESILFFLHFYFLQENSKIQLVWTYNFFPHPQNSHFLHEVDI